MGTVSFGHVSNASSGSVTSKAISITLYANTLALVGVLTHNTTPANLEKPTLAGTGGETWHEEITDTNGGASPALRLTWFYTMVATDTPTTVTATCTLSQTNIDMDYCWVGGVDISGIDGAGAVASGRSQSQNSGGSNVTSASKSLGTPSHARNGYIAICRAPSGAMGVRTGWDEEYDSAGGGSYGQVQVQSINKPDTHWSMTCSSGTYVVLIIEVVAAPDPVIIAQVQARANGTLAAGATSFTFVAQSDRTYLLIATGGAGIAGFSPTTPGLTWTLEYHPAQRSNGQEMYVYATRVTVGGEYTVQLASMPGGSVASWGTLEVQCDADTYPPHGIIQSASREFNSGGAATEAFTIAAPASRRSAMFWYQATGNSARTSQPGWQDCPTVANGAFGAGSFRANADNNAIMAWNGSPSNPLEAWFAEFAGVPTPSAPDVTINSPAAGVILVSDSIEVDVTDSDDDVNSFVPYFTRDGGTPELAWDGATFPGLYSGSSRSPITNGYRYTFTRTGGWAAAALDFTGLATDSTGLTDSATRSWTTAYVAPSNSPPVIALIDPPEGAIATTDPIEIEVTDPDGAANIAMTFGFVVFETSGVVEMIGNWIGAALPGGAPAEMFAWGAGYAASSVRAGITNGYSFTIVRDGGWVDTNIRIIWTAIDYAGELDTEDYEWTTDFDGTYACGIVEVTTPPVVTVEAPLPYNTPTSYIEPTDWITFTVTDPDAEPGVGGGLQRALPVIVYTDGTSALVHNGDDFLLPFAGSTRTAIEGGYRYTVRPSTGRWALPPTLLPFAYDLSGLEAP